ncbi:MAG: OmpH family outer membrane protein [Sedimentisphaerales bacterium]|nr:OmpH family outer membrane protein [Sedimentisphaerales bacterium]
MNFRIVLLICLVSVVFLMVGFEPSSAEPQAETAGIKIGVVSIKQIFADSKKNEKSEQQAQAQKEKILAELEKLGKEVEASEAGLRVLKPGSSDYMAAAKEALQKRANLQAQQKFYEQQMAMEFQQRIEKFYKDILRIAGEVAEEKGLALILTKDETEFPALSLNDTMLAIRTHKLLYSGGCLDITEQVMTRIDAEK